MTDPVILSEAALSGGEVEESTHFVDTGSKIGAKILRLAMLAQDDRILGLCSFPA